MCAMLHNPSPDLARLTIAMVSKRGTLLIIAGLATAPAIIQKMRDEIEPYVSTIPLFEVHKTPRQLQDVTFADGNEKKRSLVDFRGKHILVNVWATWCPPCQKELPSLERLQKKLGSNSEPEIAAISVDAIGLEQLRAFSSYFGVEKLKLYQGGEHEILQSFGIPGLPTTLLIDHDSMEIARLIGPTVWDSPEIEKQIAELVSQSRDKSRAS